jgi:tetratricopeptide (TPR) repeat protein
LPGEPAADRFPPTRAGKFIPAIIVAAGIVAYLNSLHAPFIFDDRWHIVENVRIRRLWPPGEILTHSSRPVVHLSLALNYALGGLNPWGYHAFNVGIHILAALILYGVLRRTFLSSPLRPRWGAAAPWLAGLTALIWLVHPLQTESVTYTIQRGESLMGLFYLLTLYSLIRLDGSPLNAIAWKAAAVASCLLGMACKGVIATAPVVVLLYDRAFLSPSWRELVRRRKGLYAALAATWLVYPVLLAQAPAEWRESAGFGYVGPSPLVYAMTQPSVILHYLRLALWPDQLCLDYGWPPVRGIGEAWAPGVVIGGLLAASVWAWRRKPAGGFLGAWFFLILMPTSSFLPIADIAVEHRMYLPLAAVVVLGVVGMVLVGQRGPAKGPIRIPVYAWVAGSLIVVGMAALTVRRNSDYSSELAMWEDTVRTSPGNPRAQYDVAVNLERAGQIQAAIAHYRTAIQLKPEYVDALNNLGHALSMAGRAADGMIYLQRALAIKPDLAEAHGNLGYALAQTGKLRDAAPEFEQALRIKPDYAEAHSNLGIVLALEGRTQDAIGQWQQALRLNPELVDAHNNLAYALAQTGRTREALVHYDQALRIKPDDAQTLTRAASLLATAEPPNGGDPGRAVALAERACQLTGYRDAGYLDTLAISYAAADRFDEALKTGRNALQLARSAGQAGLAREIEARLQHYREHHR